MKRILSCLRPASLTGALLLCATVPVSAQIETGIPVLQAQAPGVSAGSPEAKDIGEISLEDLLKAETTVATEKPMTVRETPGIITVVTREEIVKSGARDLRDVLLLVPGFYFGVDVEGVTGVGFRGNWGHEGKILLLVDGQSFDDGFFSTLQLGNHFPVDLIEKIEIIRGPGSAIYGGSAELAVINVTTRIGGGYRGIAGGATAGFTADAFMRQNYHLLFGDKPTEDSYIGASLFMGRALHGDRDYTDFYGNTISMRRAGRILPYNANLKGEYKGLRLRFMIDDYRTTMQDGYDAVLPAPTALDFISYFTDLSYAWKPTDRLTVTPLFSFRRQQPWNSSDADPTGPIYFERTSDKYVGSLKAAWQATDALHLTGGTQLEYQHAHNDARFSPTTFQNGKLGITYRNVAVFGQALFRHEIVNVTAGARFENHSQYGSSFVPRVALTRVFGRYHVKGLWSRAFRAPSVSNIDLSPAVKPEKTNVFEAEAGAQITDSLYFTANFYDITIKKPIVYNFDVATSAETYPNFPKTGSRGVEAELKYREKRGYGAVSYSYYNTAGKNRVPTYSVAGHTDVLLAFPSHKVTFNGAVSPVQNLWINPSVVFMSPRYGYGVTAPAGTETVRKYSELWMVNLNLRYENFIVPGLAAGAGIYNLLNENAVMIQPYDSYHAPLPGLSREFLFHLSFGLDNWERKSGPAAADTAPPSPAGNAPAE